MGFQQIGQLTEGGIYESDTIMEIKERDRYFTDDGEVYFEIKRDGGTIITRVYCIRNQWLMIPRDKGDLGRFYTGFRDVMKLRKCVLYKKYIPGFSPEEHKELQKEEKTRKTIFKATLIGAVIGALAAIIALVVYLTASK